MKKNKYKKICCRFNKINPNPQMELLFSSKFELLISVILSSQTKDIMVNNVTKKLFKVANTPKKFLLLGKLKIKKYISTLGLYNKKTEYIYKTCNILLNKYKGIIPSSRTELQFLPGIGRKNANILLNKIFGFPTIAVDTHVFRLCNRLDKIKYKNFRQVEEMLLKSVPHIFKKKCHDWLVLHGRYICSAYKPKCKKCIIFDLCNFDNKNILY